MHAKNDAHGTFNLCPVCNCKINKKHVAEHFEQHGFSLEMETLKFTDSATFEQWKTKMEKETNSRFVMERGQRNGKQDYCCHRSGSFRSKGRGVRSLKIQGSNKIGAYCPAAVVKQSLPSGQVIVTFQKTHVGHEQEVGRQLLTREERAEFASKIAMGIPLEDILDEIMYSFEGTLSRKDLTTRKDLQNIIQLYNLKNDGVLHSEDCLSVESWVAQMNAHSNFVKLYKPQGSVLTEWPQLDEQDFCLILSNNCQIEFMKKYGNDVVCVDGTHETNGYNFQLYTVLVLDDLR